MPEGIEPLPVSDLIDEETLANIIEEYENYSIQEFEKDLEINFIYMVEKDSEIIGYISISDHGNGKYKITEWPMFNPDDEEIRAQILKILLKIKLPRIRKFSISPISHKAERFLENNGFTFTGIPAFWEIEVKKK